MDDQEQELFGDLFYYAVQGVESFSNTNAVVAENPYEQILNELDKEVETDIVDARTREDVLYHFGDLPALSENIIGKHGLKLEEDSLRKEVEYLSNSYVNRKGMNNEELLYRKIAAEGVAKIFKELNEF